MRDLLQRWYDRKLTTGNENLSEDEATTKVMDLKELFSIKSEDMNAERSVLGSMPAKEIKEYVGEFDLEALDTRLGELEENPYLAVDMDSVVVDKNNKQLDSSLEHVKTHHKITLHSVEDENGLRTRYKLTDGSAVSGISQTFGAAVDMAKGFKLAGDETLDIMKIAKQYTDAVRFAVDLGAITQIGSYAIGDTLKEGKNSRNDLRETITFVAAIIKNSVKLISAIVNYYKDRKKEIERKEKEDPDYSPQEDLKFLKNKTYKAVKELAAVIAAVGKSAFKYGGNESMSGIFGLIKNGIDFVTNFVGYINADGKLAAIETANSSLESILTRDEAQKTEGDRQLIQLLKDNSQLQWGLALAARKNRAE